MLVEMELREVQISESVDRNQIVVLAEKNGAREFPIFIGYFEAQAMYLVLNGHQVPRPMTHDLIYNVIDGLEARLVGVCVDDLREETFHGKLMLASAEGKEIWVDSRPSDAIVLALKRQAPIYVDDSVLKAVFNRAGEGEQQSEQ